MDLQNLATVICPSILYSRGRDAVRDESFGAIRVVVALMENQDIFYTVPEEFLPILHDQEYFVSAMDLPTKDFVKKCETYLRLKANGKAPAPTSPGPSGGGGYNPSSSMGNLSSMGRSGDNIASGRGQPDRTQIASSPPAETFVRNGHRQQSPQPVQHAPYQYPTQNGPPASLSQGVASIHSPQPRALAQQSFDDYSLPRPAPIPAAASPRSSPRPNSFVRPKTADETSHGASGTGTLRP